MSNDPYASGSEPPEYESAEPMPDNLATIKGSVQAPAIALIVVGILNVLGTGWGVFNTIVAAMTPAGQLHKQMLDIYQAFPQIQAELNKRSPDELKNQALILWGVWTCLALVCALLTLLGGIRMVSLKNYALGICGAICAAIPCLSFSGCCCFGEIIGIWALVVLANPEVRAAFHR